jgi:hypothetical protein
VTSATTPRAESGLDGFDQAVVANLSCADCTVSARLLIFSAGVSELDLRTQGSNDRYDVALLSNGHIQVRRHNGGTITILGDTASGIADLNNWATISLSVSGANPVRLVASVNGTAKLTLSDTSASAIVLAGTAGMATNLAGIWFGSFTVSTSGGAENTDGGTLDGGTLDAGILDGGTLDGGTLDGGTLDGGPGDAGDAGPPTVIFSDDFNRTLTSGLGPNWTVLAGAWRDNDKANSDLDALDRAAVSGVSCSDCRIDAKMVNFAGGEAMLELRVSGANRYALALMASGTLQIRRYAGTSVTVLGSVASGIAQLGAWHAFAFRVSGTSPVTLTAEVDGVPKVSATDTSASAYTSSGGAGIAATAAGILFDDFTLKR